MVWEFTTVEEFIRQGARVIITGRSQETADRAVRTLGTDAIGIVSDAGKLSDVIELQKQVNLHASKIDILFVNAGYGTFAPIEQVDEAHLMNYLICL